MQISAAIRRRVSLDMLEKPLFEGDFVLKVICLLMRES